MSLYGKEAFTMKSTGMIRPVDQLGRIVLPIELRRMLDIQCKDAIEIYIENHAIVLKKYRPSCIFCNSMDGVVRFKGKPVCKACIEELQK